MSADMLLLNRKEFESRVESEKPQHFLFYRDFSSTGRSRQEMTAVLDHLNLQDMRFLNCLDVGPAYGDSLDIWKERGARECAFIERDPWFVAHNRFKGFHGWYLNHLFGLKKLPRRHFDFIWCRGGISSRSVHFRIFRSLALHLWLGSLEKLAKPGARIVVCPHFGCKYEDWVRKTFTARGYAILPRFEDHDGNYEMTFLKIMAQH
jgi:hypothetical protein